MYMRRSPSGDGPTIYRPNESVAVRLDPPPRPVAYEPDSIPPPPRDSLLMRVNRRRGQILTVASSREYGVGKSPAQSRFLGPFADQDQSDTRLSLTDSIECGRKQR